MKATIPCTFDATVGKALIGSKLPGKIVKEECEPYKYEVNGKTFELTHTYRYSDEKTIEEEVFQGEEL